MIGYVKVLDDGSVQGSGKMLELYTLLELAHNDHHGPLHDPDAPPASWGEADETWSAEERAVTWKKHTLRIVVHTRRGWAVLAAALVTFIAANSLQ